MRRLAWKRGLLGQIEAAELLPPVPLPADPLPFAKVSVTGLLRYDLLARYGAEVRDLRGGSVLGAHLLAPLERPGAPPLLVDLGWVPGKPPEPLPRAPAPATVAGFVRPAEQAGWFSAPDDIAGRNFYTLNPRVIGAALGLPAVAPFTLVALGAAPLNTYPDPTDHLPHPPNNHLQYAITWYGLAAALVVVFVLYVVKGPRA